MGSVTLFGREITLNERFNLEIGGEVTVDDDGRNDIKALLRDATGMKPTLPKSPHPEWDLPNGWDWRPIVQSGPYRGKFANRVSAFFKKQHNITLSQELLATIGNIAAAHMTKPQFIVADLTDNFDWERGDFGDAGSCYWSSRSEDKEIIRFHGTLALRFYRPGNRSGGYARCWLIPNEPESGSFIIFNGYGIPGDSTLNFAQFTSRWLGAEYKRIGLTVNKRSEGTVYINNGVGYLIGSAELIKKTNGHNLIWHARFPKCCHCDRHARADEVVEEHMLDGNFYCSAHWDHYVTICDKCETHRLDRGQRARFIHGGVDRQLVCQHCYDAAPHCEGCDHRFANADYITTHENVQWSRNIVSEHINLCPECASRLVTCEDCNKRFAGITSINSEKRHYCDSCAEVRARKAAEERERVVRALIEERRKTLAALRAAADETDAEVAETREFLGAEGVLFVSDKNGNILDRVTLDIPQS